MMKINLSTGKLGYLLLWSAAILYLLVSPSLYYRFFPQEGKPLAVWTYQPEKTKGIRYNVEGCKFWSKNAVSYAEGETYALWGWSFLNRGPDTLQADYDRFAVIYDDTHSYVFPMKIFKRPGVQEVFKDLGMSDLASAGFYAVISRNALAVGEYGIGLLFTHKQDGTKYYVQTNKILVRTPNHLLVKPKEK